MATKIKDDFELQVSCETVERLQRALEGVQRIPNPDIRQMCAESTRFMIEKIEREIEEYLAQKAAETAVEQTRIQSVPASAENL